MPSPTTKERRVGRNRDACRIAAGAISRSRVSTDRALASTFRTSPLPRKLLQLGQAQVAKELDLMLEHHAKLLVGAPPRLCHERECVGRRRATGVLDEVRVLRRNLRAADRVTAEAARVEHPPRAQLVIRVLEDAPERALVRRLRVLAPFVELADLGADLLARPRTQAELGLEDDLTVL